MRFRVVKREVLHVVVTVEANSEAEAREEANSVIQRAIPIDDQTLFIFGGYCELGGSEFVSINKVEE